VFETGYIEKIAGILAGLIFLISCFVMHIRLRSYSTLALTASAICLIALNPIIDFVVHRYLISDPLDASLGRISEVLTAARIPAMDTLAFIFCVSFLLSAMSIRRRP
jgi:hypothetical protein